MRLIFSDRALSDIEAILDYIGNDKPSAAVRFGEGLFQTCDLLQTNPELGMLRSDLSTGIRLFTYRGYGLYYRLDQKDQVVSLERVLHPALDISTQEFA